MKRTALIAVVTFLIDQVTKLGVVFGLNLSERGDIDVLPPILAFKMAWNQGVNFGLGSGGGEVMRWILIAAALAISVWVWTWIAREGNGPWARTSAGLLIGGALGNVVDRIAYGAVADFLNMSCCGFENPYAFNVADIAIFAGAIGLVLFSKDGPQKPKAAKPRKTRTPRRKTP